MPLSAYGHYGPVLLLIPTAAADYLEYERFGLLESIRPWIDGGKVKVMSIDSINRESWLSEDMPYALRADMKNGTAMYLMKWCLLSAGIVPMKPTFTPAGLPLAPCTR
jgi:esterase/lipase superfamily enzyme